MDWRGWNHHGETAITCECWSYSLCGPYRFVSINQHQGGFSVDVKEDDRHVGIFPTLKEARDAADAVIEADAA